MRGSGGESVLIDGLGAKSLDGLPPFFFNHINHLIMKHFNKYWGLYFALLIIVLTIGLYSAVHANEASLYRLSN